MTISSLAHIRHTPVYFLLGVLLAVVLTGCGALRFQQPTVTAGAVKLASLDFQKADLAVELQVTNPNSTTLTVAGYSYDLMIENQPFLAGTSDASFDLRPKDVTIVSVPLSVKFSDLLDKLNALKGKADAGYVLTLSLGVKTPVGTYPLSFHKEGRVPVLTVPQIRLRSVRMASLSAQGVAMEAIVEVTDPGPSVKLTSLKYAVSMNGQQLTAGSDDQPQTTSTGDGHLIRIPLLVDSSNAQRLLGSLVLGTEKPTFTVAGQATFSSPLGPIALPFTHTQKIKPSR